MIYGSLDCNELYANTDRSNKLSTLSPNSAEEQIQLDSCCSREDEGISEWVQQKADVTRRDEVGTCFNN